MQQLSIKPNFTPLISHPPYKFKLKTPKISSKWPKKAPPISQNPHKLIFNSMAYIASTLNIFPEPWETLLKQFLVASASGGGNGGKIWFKKRFRGGGGGKGRRLKLGVWLILLIASSLSLWVILGSENGGKIDLGLWVLLVILYGFGVYLLVLKGWRREVKNWVLGFCCGGGVVGLSLNYNHVFSRWVDDFLGSNCKGFVGLKKLRKGKRWV